MDDPGLQLSLVVQHLGKLAAAYLLAMPVALDRERRARSAGLRTFPLVAVASCGYVLVTQEALGADSERAVARVISGLMTGIGFVGGGAILKHEGHVSGTATAAAIWCTGAIGAAAALGRWEVALAISLVTSLTLAVLQPLKERVGKAENADAA